MLKVRIFEQAVHHRRSKLKIGWTIKKDLNNKSLVPFTSGDMQPWVPPTTETIQNELSLSFCASCSHYLNLVQTCWVNTFHIELICILVTSSTVSVLWALEIQKKSPFTTIIDRTVGGIGNEKMFAWNTPRYRVWLKLQRIIFIVSMLITCMSCCHTMCCT